MKLGKLIYNVSLCAVGVMFTACSDIAEDERFIYVEPAEVAKRVLIEDFTGQRCVNCVTGAATIEQIMETYGEENVIAVGLYGGALGSEPLGGPPYPLTIEESEWYYAHWGIEGSPQPMAMIDRGAIISNIADWPAAVPMAMIDRGAIISNIADWPAAVRDRIQMQAPVLLEASCNYDAASRQVEITVDADGVSAISGQLQVWLTEDSIVSKQSIPGQREMDEDYVHNHVFRATVNAPMGDAVTVGVGERATRTFTYTLKEDWVADNMSVVTFIYDDSGVLQAAKAPIIPKAEDAEGEGGAE